MATLVTSERTQPISVTDTTPEPPVVSLTFEENPTRKIKRKIVVRSHLTPTGGLLSGDLYYFLDHNKEYIQMEYSDVWKLMCKANNSGGNCSFVFEGIPAIPRWITGLTTHHFSIPPSQEKREKRKQTVSPSNPPHKRQKSQSPPDSPTQQLSSEDETLASSVVIPDIPLDGGEPYSKRPLFMVSYKLLNKTINKLVEVYGDCVVERAHNEMLKLLAESEYASRVAEEKAKFAKGRNAQRYITKRSVPPKVEDFAHRSVSDLRDCIFPNVTWSETETNGDPKRAIRSIPSCVLPLFVRLLPSNISANTDIQLLIEECKSSINTVAESLVRRQMKSHEDLKTILTVSSIEISRRVQLAVLSICGDIVTRNGSTSSTTESHIVSEVSLGSSGSIPGNDILFGTPLFGLQPYEVFVVRSPNKVLTVTEVAARYFSAKQVLKRGLYILAKEVPTTTRREIEHINRAEKATAATNKDLTIYVTTTKE